MTGARTAAADARASGRISNASAAAASSPPTRPASSLREPCAPAADHWRRRTVYAGMGAAAEGTRPAVRNEGVGYMHEQARRPPQRMWAVRASVVGRWPAVVRSVMTAAAAVVVVAALWATAAAR